ncbi:hypothetical protein TNCV_950711 [Trichonephila clavipes]|nr:hypothetical protein TNCV_950711 [Trichonephila clavipes]
MARGRPAPDRRLTFPVSWDRFHSLATLLATPTAFATLRCVCPDSSLPITRHAMGIPDESISEKSIFEGFIRNAIREVLVGKKYDHDKISEWINTLIGKILDQLSDYSINKYIG